MCFLSVVIMYSARDGALGFPKRSRNVKPRQGRQGYTMLKKRAACKLSINIRHTKE